MCEWELEIRLDDCLVAGRVDVAHVGDVQGPIGDGDDAAGAKC